MAIGGPDTDIACMPWQAAADIERDSKNCKPDLGRVIAENSWKQAT
jgi:hypothetical protein